MGDDRLVERSSIGRLQPFQRKGPCGSFEHTENPSPPEGEIL